MGVDIVELVSEEAHQTAKIRKLISRFGECSTHSIGTLDHYWLRTDLISKKMLPMLARIHARSLDEFKEALERSDSPSEKLFSHDGEEILFVPSGEVVLHTQHYTLVRLSAGDCAYIDSKVEHVCLRGSEE